MYSCKCCKLLYCSKYGVCVCVCVCVCLCTQSDSSQGFIRVQAPEFSKVSMAVQLTEDLQASDILVRFVSQER